MKISLLFFLFLWKLYKDIILNGEFLGVIIGCRKLINYYKDKMLKWNGENVMKY